MRAWRRLSHQAYVLRLWAFLALAHGEFHALAFLKGTEPVHADGGIVHKDIATRIAFQEAVSFGAIEPFHRTLFTLCHVELLLSGAGRGLPGLNVLRIVLLGRDLSRRRGFRQQSRLLLLESRRSEMRQPALALAASC